MDIHKPKPWHNVREFLKEYLIIVVGVLTALGAEAVVATLHENRLSAEARDSVRAEINLDLASARQRDGWQPCIDARFAELDKALAAAEEGKGFQPLAYIGRPRSPSLYVQRWDAATSGGRTSLLSTEEQQDFARVYSRLQLAIKDEEDERAGWARLRGLEGVKHPSAETVALARQALSEARAADFSLRRQIHSARFYAARLGIMGDAKIVEDFKQTTESVCVPTSTRRDDVAALINDPVGAP